MAQFRKLLTLVLVRKEHSLVLLGLKKRGFGVGKWNGFGGKVEPGESIIDGAVRELREESGLVVKPEALTKFGLIDFEFVGDPVILEVHLFSASTFEGEPVETEEMQPQWFNTDAIPFDLMWADDRQWFPLFLSGKKFKGYFLFQGHSTIVKQSLQPVMSCDEEKSRKVFTLVLPVDDVTRRVLLGLKKRGLGQDKYNGFGGKIEKGETVRQAAVRELFEESGQRVEERHLNKCAVLEMDFADQPVRFEIHVFRCNFRPVEAPVETDEMIPEWFAMEEIPYDRMWNEARLWLPVALSGSPFRAAFLFNGDRIEEHKIHPCQPFQD